MKLTKSAKAYVAKHNVSARVIEKASQIAKADHRGFTNANDVSDARGFEAIDKGFGYLGTFKTQQESNIALSNCGRMSENSDI